MAATCPFSVDKSRGPLGTAANMQQSKSARIRPIPQPPASLLLLVRPGGRTLHTTEQYAPELYPYAGELPQKRETGSVAKCVFCNRLRSKSER